MTNAPSILGNATSLQTTSDKNLNPLQHRIDGALGIGEDVMNQLPDGKKFLCSGMQLAGSIAVPGAMAFKGYKLAKTFAAAHQGEKGIKNLKAGAAVIGGAYVAGQGIDGVNTGLNLLH